MTPSRTACAAAAAAAALAGCAEPDPDVQVGLEWAGGESPTACRAKVAGKPLTEPELLAAARRWRGHRVTVAGSEAIPFKCVGWAVWVIQRAGVARVGFISEPPPKRRKE